jgi:hypothetical protein
MFMPPDTITPAAETPQPSTKGRAGPVNTVSNNTSALTLGDLERARTAVRCRDCRLDLEPGLTLRAAFACPRFGKPRSQHSGPCESFVPKSVLP